MIMFLRQCYVIQVYMPSLSPNPFMPNKLCRSVDDAKKYAAEHVLSQLCPVESIQNGMKS